MKVGDIVTCARATKRVGFITDIEMRADGSYPLKVEVEWLNGTLKGKREWRLPWRIGHMETEAACHKARYEETMTALEKWNHAAKLAQL